MADAYVDSMLGDGETILAQGRQHWMALIRFAIQPIVVFLAAIVCYLIGTWLTPTGDGLFDQIFRWIDTLLGLLTAGLFILALAWFPLQVLRWVKRRYLVTDRRVLYVEGVLRRNSRDAGLAMITDVGFRQSFLGRRMGFGDLNIATAANRPLHFREMRDAIAFKKVIMAAQQGTIEKRADEILGKPAAVPSVAAVATAIDPTNFPPPTPAWDGSDVVEMAEDDVPPSDAELLGIPPAAPAEAVTEAGTVPEAGAAPDVATEVVEPPVVEPPVVEAAAVEDVAAAATTAPEAPAAEPAQVDSVIDAPEAETATGAAGVTEALARLADLRDSGAITDEDYEARKQDLLGRL